MVVGVEDPDDEAVEAKDHHHGEEHPAQADGEVDELLVNVWPMNSGITKPAVAMKTTAIAPSTVRIRKNSVEASLSASLRRPCSSSSVKTGTNAALSAASANRLRTTLGTWKAIVNALNAPLVAK